MSKMLIEPNAWVRLPKKAKYVRVRAIVAESGGPVCATLEFMVNGRELA